MTLSTFQKCLFELCFAIFIGCNKNIFWGLSTWNNTCFLFKCRITFGCAIFRTLRSVLWLFTSCVWDVSRYRILREKIAFDFFGNVVFVVLDCVRSFWRFLYKSLKNVGQCHQNQITFLLKWRWGRPKVFALSCASLVSLVVNEKAVVRSSRLIFVN